KLTATHRYLHSFPTRRSSDLDGHRVEERAALKEHPELFPHAVQLFLGMIGDVFVFDDDAAAVRRFQSEHMPQRDRLAAARSAEEDRKSTRLNSSHDQISYAVF